MRKLFLASFELGGHEDELVSLVPPGRVAICANAVDCAPSSMRTAVCRRTREIFEELGYTVEELDLRAWFGREGLAAELARFDLFWATGGNTFVLMVAMKLAHFAEALAASSVAYGGYSAGAVAAGTTLHGVEHVDPIDEIPLDYPSHDVVWDGLRLVDYAIVPHWEAQYEDVSGLDKMVRELRQRGEKHRTLRDDQVIIVR